MPHVIIKFWPGQSERRKAKLSELIVKDVTSVLGYGEESVLVGFDEIESSDWVERVYKPE